MGDVFTVEHVLEVDAFDALVGFCDGFFEGVGCGCGGDYAPAGGEDFAVDE